MYKIFIDGQEGTTGLKIFDRLSVREDIEILSIDPMERKSLEARMDKINKADLTFLCLPDQAAIEIAKLAPLDKKIIDASTAHRINKDWTYGFPEISNNQKVKIQESSRVSVPGCHASGFVAIVKPLIEYNIISYNTFLNVTSLTGYSGGGKAMISLYEEGEKDNKKFPRIYSLNQTHKHLPEMLEMTGLSKKPAFIPIVTNYYSGMVSSIPLDMENIENMFSIKEIIKSYNDFYKNQQMVKVIEEKFEDSDGMLGIGEMSGRDDMEIIIHGNNERVVISARYDNLGKGASGAAIQCMNIMLGMDETTSLVKGNNYEK